ncbi:MAG: hypothetical protein A2V45_13365 [Candidatus Aminicenantes bacterium RBG_19FT_COMBO_58_17]|nr:MAG: hypothetical protein A2V45_13365 [Candidatus Aminicenantes bacterium RBG_19FT_COMBO_58_17]
MTFPFAWNDFADQPHNVAPRRERLRHHFKHGGSYLGLAAANSALAIPVFLHYRRYMKMMHRRPVEIGTPFAVSCSPAGARNEEVVESLKAAGVRQTLVRIPSWERGGLSRYQAFIRLLRREGLDVVAALLQRRDDVLEPASWTGFLADVFSGFSTLCSHFEVGHAWNRTKWGVWDHREYIALAKAAVPLAEKHGVRLVGPAVIDFEFHLYPPVLRAVAFDKVSSLLYVDRSGAPENAQFGWTTAKKVALWKAIVDTSCRGPKSCWITEMNWPLAGAGEYSPAPGKPCVSEEEQANYLVRYFVICLASGFVERIYWWQLAAPGYGLIDSRGPGWRKRPGYFALRQMARLLEGSRFEGKADDAGAEIYWFHKEDREFAVCWTRQGAVDHEFIPAPRQIVGRDGEERPAGSARVRIEERPQYVFTS